MSQQELLIRVVEVLERIGVPYMLTGSFASSLQGEPRSTHDIDLVVEFPASRIDMLLKEFPRPEFYLSEQSIRDAFEHDSMFNLLHIEQGDKVDFWLLTDEEFDQSRFSRRVVEEIDGREVLVSSPEDTILAKLRWAQLSGGSEKQFGDALSIYEVQKETLDPAYLEQWAQNLGVEALWAKLKESSAES